MKFKEDLKIRKWVVPLKIKEMFTIDWLKKKAGGPGRNIRIQYYDKKIIRHFKCAPSFRFFFI